MNSNLQGTGVALATPFKEDGSIDFESLLKLLQHVSKGVDYLVLNGTTGESATTEVAEQIEILHFIKENNLQKLPIVFGVGGNNTRDVIQKIEKYDLSGIEAILSVSPYYNKPSQEGLFQHYSAIASSSPVPLILYNVPGRTGSNITAKTTLRLSENENIAGIKEASGDLAQALEISQCTRKDFLLISGDDLLTIPLIAFGARGVISVLANAFPVHFSQMVKFALESKNTEAASILRKFVQLNPCIYEEGNPVGIKTVLEAMSICQSTVRLPLVKGSARLRDKITQCMKGLV